MHLVRARTGTVVGYTAADIDTWATVMARSLFAAGGRPGDLLHNAYGYGLFTGGLGAHYGGEKLGCTVVPFGGGQTERQIQLITDFEPRLITVTPSYCLNLIEEMERLGIDPAATSLQVGIFGAEPWTEGMRTEIEERLGIDAVDIYGLSEVIGPGVATDEASMFLLSAFVAKPSLVRRCLGEAEAACRAEHGRRGRFRTEWNMGAIRLCLKS